MRRHHWWLVAGLLLGAAGAMFAVAFEASSVRYANCSSMVPHILGCFPPSPGALMFAVGLLGAGALLAVVGLSIRVTNREKAQSAPKTGG